MLAVVGCGRVGLPLALCLADRGSSVLGVEIDPVTRERLDRGTMPFPDAFAEDLLARNHGRSFRVTGDLAAAAACDTFILAVGTPLDDGAMPRQEPLAELVDRILEMAPAPVPRHGSRPPLIIIRSTVAPGTADGLFRRVGRRQGAELGRDFLLASCPERTLEGHSEELLELPQIIGTRDAASREAAAEVFRSLGVELVFTGTVEAELAKLFANAHRHVNFALANEFMIIARNHGARVHEALRAANHNYRRGGIPNPGYASGPCLYKDGFILTTSLPFAGLILEGWRTNEALPEYLIRQVELVRPLSKAAVLGLAFKADTDDARNSLGIKLVRLLEMRGVEAIGHDPIVTLPGGLSTTDLERALAGAREVFVVVPHREYVGFPWDTVKELVAPGCVVADPWLVWGQEDVVVALAPAP